jgi:hypothetical protein
VALTAAERQHIMGPHQIQLHATSRTTPVAGFGGTMTIIGPHSESSAAELADVIVTALHGAYPGTVWEAEITRLSDD